MLPPTQARRSKTPSALPSTGMKHVEGALYTGASALQQFVTEFEPMYIGERCSARAI